ncbi:hypothetical protein QCA50_018921 [Cerrena zonata]|uniref:Autophagy-related protein 11 n=1 Tax=Cerrena zonata TaxID=2478898 RepID=A0AAW0FAB5_9APHY
MIQICRAEDGQVFQVNTTLNEIERLGSLERFLGEETGVDHDSVLAYLSDGTRLRSDNVRELAGDKDQTIFVFNKTYLDYDIDDVLDRLRVQAPLQPPAEDRVAAPAKPSQLATAYLRTAHIHSDEIDRTVNSLRHQLNALKIASSTLDLHVLAISDAFEGISSNAQQELNKQATLLDGIDADLDIIGQVEVHREFLSVGVRKAIDAGEKPRTLGNYVKRERMVEVAQNCQRVHSNMKKLFTEAEESMDELRDGANTVRTTVADDGVLKEAELSVRRSKDLVDKITDAVGSLEKITPSSSKLEEMQRLDVSLREELVHATELKNHFTESFIHALRQISVLNNYLVELPIQLTSLQTAFRDKTKFAHIQRLHHLLYVYGATVIEIVRRKEFAQLFYRRAQIMLEIMAKLSSNERKRRQLFRGEVHGQLPFDIKGMDEPVPSIDFTPTRPSDTPYSLERSDVETLMHVLDDLEHFARDSSNHIALTSVQDARAGLEKLIVKMDSLESGFDRIAERSLLSSSRWVNSRRRHTEADEQAYTELEAHIAELKHAKAEQDAAHQRERRALEQELAQLRSQLTESDTARTALERDIHSLKAHLESETTSRRILEARNNELTSEATKQRNDLATALAEATGQTKTAEALRQELTQARAEFEEVKSLESRNASNVANLLEEQARALRRLEEARSRGEDLESQIQQARKESDELQQALSEASKDKDRLLRAQASEHDRLLRDHIAEADGDRAVLEHQYLELQAALENTERQLKDARAQVEMANSDAMGLREELQRVEHEVREARHVERVLREDLREGRVSQSDFELQLENSNRLIAQILDVALRFRESHVKALAAAQAMTVHPGSSKNAAVSASLSESSFSALRRGVTNHLDEPLPIDPSDPAAALEILRTFDHDQFLEAIQKTGSTIRKWQKQCKEYRERAKGKISFRNFAKGDLALFLPTRNSVSKPWAAFNVSFPHYFLQATGHLAEQLKTREWVVARITSITERVVDVRDVSTNPYGLGDGVKYYMLEVEDWTQSHNSSSHHHHSSKRRTGIVSSSNRRQGTLETEGILSTSPPTTPPSGPGTGISPPADGALSTPPAPPEPEVEDSFTVTHPLNGRLFPSPTRTNSIPTAGPSSLSRLLAQADGSLSSESAAGVVQSPLDIIPQIPLPLGARDSNTSSHLLQPPPSPIRSTAPSTPQIGTQGTGSGSGPSTVTLRPGSRASKQSSSSRFSNRVPFAPAAPSIAKPTATAALAVGEQQLTPGSPGTSPPSKPSPRKIQNRLSGSSINPSPESSPTEGMTNLSNILAQKSQHRRSRTTSHSIIRNSPLAAAFPTSKTTPEIDTNSSMKASGSAAGSPPGPSLPTGVTARSRLASLASSWGVSFARKRLSEVPQSPSGSGNASENEN